MLQLAIRGGVRTYHSPSWTVMHTSVQAVTGSQMSTKVNETSQPGECSAANFSHVVSAQVKAHGNSQWLLLLLMFVCKLSGRLAQLPLGCCCTSHPNKPICLLCSLQSVTDCSEHSCCGMSTLLTSCSCWLLSWPACWSSGLNLNTSAYVVHHGSSFFNA